MRAKWLSVPLLTALLVAGTVPAAESATTAPPGYRLTAVTARSPFHGIHGLTFTHDGRLLAGSVVGRTIYQVDPRTGATSTYLPPPAGMADDLDESPTGTLAWTAPNDGRLYLRDPGGQPRVAAEGLYGLNSVSWTRDGRLFAAQVSQGDALWEIDPTGATAPRLVARDLGGLNGFDFAPDGTLYGPLIFRGTIVRIDVATGAVTTVATGFTAPGAVKFSPAGQLFAVDTATGGVFRVDTATGTRFRVAQLRSAVDNLAFDRTGRLFVTNMADNAVLEVDPRTGATRTVVSGPLAIAADLDVVREGGRDVLYVSDGFAFRKVDTVTGCVTDVARMYGDDLAFPTGVSVAGDDVVVAGWTEGSLQVFNRRTGASSGVHRGFVTPMDAIRLPGGDLVYSDFAEGTLVRVDATTWATTTIASGLPGPSMLAAGSSGAVLVSDAAGRISRVDVATGAASVVVSGLAQPEGFAVAPGGDLVIAEVGLRRIVRVNPATGQLTVVRDNLPIGFEGLPQAPPIYIPTGVAVAANGDIYFSSDLDSAVYRLRPGRS